MNSDIYNSELLANKCNQCDNCKENSLSHHKKENENIKEIDEIIKDTQDKIEIDENELLNLFNDYLSISFGMDLLNNNLNEKEIKINSFDSLLCENLFYDSDDEDFYDSDDNIDDFDDYYDSEDSEDSEEKTEIRKNVSENIDKMINDNKINDVMAIFEIKVKHQYNNNLEECEICMENKSNCKLDCNHVFCLNCFVKHKYIYENNSCPFCKQDTGDTITYYKQKLTIANKITELLFNIKKTNKIPRGKFKVYFTDGTCMNNFWKSVKYGKKCKNKLYKKLLKNNLLKKDYNSYSIKF